MFILIFFNICFHILFCFIPVFLLLASISVYFISFCSTSLFIFVHWMYWCSLNFVPFHWYLFPPLPFFSPPFNYLHIFLCLCWYFWSYVFFYFSPVSSNFVLFPYFMFPHCNFMFPLCCFFLHFAFFFCFSILSQQLKLDVFLKHKL